MILQDFGMLYDYHTLSRGTMSSRPMPVPALPYIFSEPQISTPGRRENYRSL